jgi:hypothetical protein
VGGREGEDLEGFRDVLLEPTGKARGGLVVAGDHVLESPIGFGTVVGVVDASKSTPSMPASRADARRSSSEPPCVMGLSKWSSANGFSDDSMLIEL